MNFLNMAKQLQSMQSELKKARSALKNLTAEGQAAGGAVRVELSGSMEVKHIHLDPALVAQNDARRLETLVKEALSQALSRAQQLAASQLGSIPGLGSGLGA
ncbi:MAG: YbaB/EbfC family nucleoid-associated protein [candidate division FCPU426 bacterium]